MTGIQFITDEKGRKTAAVIDLKKHKGCGRIFRMSSFLSRADTKKVSRSTR